MNAISNLVESLRLIYPDSAMQRFPGRTLFFK
jgi:hypothetical protein